MIGVPHPTLGQEPFAIVKTFGDKSEAETKQRILDVFGKDYALGGAVSLEELGLNAFPLNATGKVIKTSLLERLLDFLNKRKADPRL